MARVDLDMAAILAPLAGPSPTGQDLHAESDSILDIIREARRQDDGLDQGIWVTERKMADWDKVVGLCQQVLVTKSKDLMVAAWLVEALVHRDGFGGLEPGFLLLEEFCRGFWEELYPRPDEDGDVTGRGNAIQMLDKRLPQVLRTLPLTSSGFAEPVRFTWADYEMARLHHGPDGQFEGPSMGTFQTSAESSPRILLEHNFASVSKGLVALERLAAALDDMFHSSPPSLMGITALLRDVENWLAAILPVPAEAEAPAAPSQDQPQGEPEMSSVASSPGGPITNRDDAYRRLAEVVEYLMRTEPHSPTPYVLRRVLAWGRMPLDEVLQEMASGRNDLTAILELISLKR